MRIKVRNSRAFFSKGAIAKNRVYGGYEDLIFDDNFQIDNVPVIVKYFYFDMWMQSFPKVPDKELRVL